MFVSVETCRCLSGILPLWKPTMLKTRSESVVPCTPRTVFQSTASGFVSADSRRWHEQRRFNPMRFLLAISRIVAIETLHFAWAEHLLAAGAAGGWRTYKRAGGGKKGRLLHTWSVRHNRVFTLSRRIATKGMQHGGIFYGLKIERKACIPCGATNYRDKCE